MIPNQYAYDEDAVMRSPVGQRALREGVADSLLFWCRKESRNNPPDHVVDRLIRTKAENDQIEREIRANPARYTAADQLIGIREAMRAREADLRARHLRDERAAA